MDLQEEGVRVLRRAAFVVVALVGVVALAGGEARAQYAIVDLGSIGTRETAPRAINADGQVAGDLVERPSGAPLPFRWQGGELAQLVAPHGSAAVLGIGPGGDVVGSALDATDGSPQAFLWASDGGARFLEQYPGASSEASAINNLGVAVGRVDEPTLGPWPALWEGDVLCSLITPSGRGGAMDVNDAGEIVGWGAGFRGLVGACLWGPGGTTFRFLVAPSPLGAAAFAMNDVGQVVGFASFPGHSLPHAFLWENGEVIDLGALDGDQSGARDVNNAGDVVGFSVLADGRFRAALWTSGALNDLNDLLPAGSGWVLEVATSINDGGAIVGAGTRDGETNRRGFLLLPEPVRCRAGNVNARAGAAANVVFVTGSPGDDHFRRVTVQAGVATTLTIRRAPRTRGVHADWALWIYEGEAFDCVPVEVRNRAGGVFDLGRANACLPLANSVTPGSCAPPLADLFGVGPIGITSKRLHPNAAARFFLSTKPMPPSPTELPVTFPPGTFSIYSVHEDRNSASGIEVSVGNTIVVESLE